MVLDLIGITKSYQARTGRVVVLRDVSLSVGAGEIVWLSGASGSGKSSLLRVAGLLSSPDKGRVVLLGSDAVAGPGSESHRRRTIGFVFQQGNLLPELTVADNIRIATKTMTKEAVIDLLGAWGMAEVSDRPAKQISGGEAQRAALCRALVNNPPLLLVDEPTSGLDDTNADLVRRQLSRLRNEGRAILIASHDGRVREIADRSVVIDGGEFHGR